MVVSTIARIVNALNETECVIQNKESNKSTYVRREALSCYCIVWFSLEGVLPPVLSRAGKKIETASILSHINVWSITGQRRFVFLSFRCIACVGTERTLLGKAGPSLVSEHSSTGSLLLKPDLPSPATAACEA